MLITPIYTILPLTAAPPCWLRSWLQLGPKMALRMLEIDHLRQKHWPAHDY